MQTDNELLGWEFAANVLGYNIGAELSQEYINLIQEAIQQIEDNINNHQYRNLGVKQLQGYMLEEWAAGTFNIDAIASGSSDRAEVLHSLLKDSTDITLHSGAEYSAKSYGTADQTAKAQARLDIDTGVAAYHDQERLVPSDQLSDAKQVAHIQALRNKLIRPHTSKAYAETEAHLTDTLTNDEGVSSQKISRKELEKIAKESKKQSFDAAEHDLTVDTAIKTDYLLKQALKAGYTAAAVTVAFQLAPEIYKVIDYLIKNGELDIVQIKKMGEKGISSGAESFIRGAISSSLLIMCEKGALGESFIGINPSLLGTVTALVMQTVKNSILVAAGKMSTKQMGAAFADTVIISGGYLVGAKIGGAIGQALGFELPVVGYLLGSLIGSAFCVAYNIGKNKLIAFCVDSGFTCFGLVEQNYELPEEVLNDLGVEIIEIPRAKIERIEAPRTIIPQANISETQYETIDIQMLRRGVIGINKVGYVLN